MVVPLRPGRLIDPDASEQEHPDEVDEMIDDLFGPATEGGPSWFDAVLVSAGTALILWSVLGHGSPGLVVGGALALALGLILPARSAWRAVRRWRLAHRRRAALSHGLPLNVSSPVTANLLKAYQRLIDVARLPGVSLGPDAIKAAHSSLVEAASVVGGSAPSTGAEERYVTKRTQAISELTAALKRQNEAWAAQGKQRSQEVDVERRLERTALVEAWEEVDEIGSVSSLRQIEGLVHRLKGAGDDAG